MRHFRSQKADTADVTSAGNAGEQPENKWELSYVGRSIPRGIPHFPQ
jgi:hypothetical protein